MIDIKAHFDRRKDHSGVVMIHAVGTLPENCSDIEIIVAHIVKGLAKQMPESPDLCRHAALRFSLAAAEGAKRGLKDYFDETK